MKVLFAVNDEKISESIIKRYQKDYKEIISAKNVYYYNAIIKELQKDKSYDRVVIGEDLEPFSSDDYSTIDKFLFDKLDKISDEAYNTVGNDIPIILICTDRRSRPEPLLIKLFGISIYNALIGQDRSIDEVCKLLKKPRSKKEAKIYYRIDLEKVEYKPENESDVSETEIQNILAHYKRLGKDEEKFVTSFDSIVSQYNEEQLKLIINFLPKNVIKVLEDKSSTYRQIVGLAPKNTKKTSKSKDMEMQKIEILDRKTNRTNLSTRVIIPNSVNTQKVKKVIENNIENNEEHHSDHIKNKEKIVLQKEEKKAVNEKNDDVTSLLEEIEKPVKRGRGRPPKIRQEEVIETETKVKKGRGRPPKEKVENKDIDDLLMDFQNFDEGENKSSIKEKNAPKKTEKKHILPKEDENNVLPGYDDEFENVLPGYDDEVEETENILPEYDAEEDETENVLPGYDEEDEETENVLPGYDEEDEETENVLPGYDEEDDETENVLPGYDEEDEETENVLPGYDEEDDETENVLPGYDEEDEETENVLPGYDEEDDETENSLPGYDEEDDETENSLPGYDDEEDEDNLTGYDDDETSENSNFRGTIQNVNFNNNGGENINNSIQNRSYSGTQMNVNIDSLLTSDKKIVSFVGTSKNGTSFLVNNLAQMLSERGIKTAILDLTQNRNAYYVYTDNREDLRDIAYKTIDNLIKGIPEGININKNLTVFTSLPNEIEGLKNTQKIMETLIDNYSLILLDCDYQTEYAYFNISQEIYLVQSLDVLTIQPLTAFLRELKARNILDQNKLRVVINKFIKSQITNKMLIGGISSYNDPSMSYMTELFNKDKMKYITIPFEIQNYAIYLESLVNCNISLKGYSKTLMKSLEELGNMVFPLLGSAKNQANYNNYNNFSKNTNSTLNKMKTKF